MKPDRTNYETWLIDWLDGNLTGQQTRDLVHFLNNNPDIREEADSILPAGLSVPKINYNDKEHLKKSPDQLPASQIEYLSAGYLENDLTGEQFEELKQSIMLNNRNKLLFDSIQKTKLAPPVVAFRNKNSLKKLTAGDKLIRLSLAGLSAAAGIAILIISYIMISKNRMANQIMPEAAMNKNTLVITTRSPLIPAGQDKELAERIITRETVKNAVRMRHSELISKRSVNATAQLPAVSPDFVKMAAGTEPMMISYLPWVRLSVKPGNYNLVASGARITLPGHLYSDDERSGLNKFIARTFRQKVLKEKTNDNAPLRPYELAEAGISGLNSLLGWEMALVKNNDVSGRLKSVSFTSRILKFNAPVKNTDDEQ